MFSRAIVTFANRFTTLPSSSKPRDSSHPRSKSNGILNGISGWAPTQSLEAGAEPVRHARAGLRHSVLNFGERRGLRRASDENTMERVLESHTGHVLESALERNRIVSISRCWKLGYREVKKKNDRPTPRARPRAPADGERGQFASAPRAGETVLEGLRPDTHTQERFAKRF